MLLALGISYITATVFFDFANKSSSGDRCKEPVNLDLMKHF